MKKILAAALSVTVLAISLTACSGGASSSAAPAASTPPAASTADSAADPSDAYPAKKVTLICPSDAGGAMDQNCRMMAPYLEKHLGVPVEVINMGGSACWVGWSYL